MFRPGGAYVQQRAAPGAGLEDPRERQALGREAAGARVRPRERVRRVPEQPPQRRRGHRSRGHRSRGHRPRVVQAGRGELRLRPAPGSSRLYYLGKIVAKTVKTVVILLRTYGVQLALCRGVRHAYRGASRPY